MPALPVWWVLIFSEKYCKEKWQKQWDEKISWQKLLPRPQMELIRETFRSWKLRKHWHEFLLKDAFCMTHRQYFAVYLRYKPDLSAFIFLGIWSQSRGVCSEVLKWALLDWSITGFWEHRVKVTRKYSGFCQNRPDPSISRGHGIGMNLLIKILKSPKPLTVILVPIPGWWGHRSPQGPEKLIQRLKCCTAHLVAVVWIAQSFQEVHGNALG